MQTLSKKGVLFLTSGFHQFYVFQNLAHIVENGNGQNQKKSLKIILSDGEIYISGVFVIKNQSDLDICGKIKQFDFLKVFASYQGGTKPILITSLQIFSQGHKGIYGLPPISLKDYMESRLLKSSNVHKKSQRTENFQYIEEQKRQKNFSNDLQSNPQQNQKKAKEVDENLYKVVQNIQSQPNANKQFSFELSNEESEYDLLNDLNEISSKKREQKAWDNHEIVNNPQKRHKPNEDQHQQGEIGLQNQSQKIIQTNNTNKNLQKNEFQISTQTKKDLPLKSGNELKVNKTQTYSIKKHKQIEIIDLDCEPTQKQAVPFFGQSNRRQYRKSDLKFIEEILQSDDKQTQKQSLYNRKSEQYNESNTVPRSQTLQEQTVITPTKTFDSKLILNSSNQQIMSSTTQRKKLRQEYNLLIENLYESNSSFKIICRVNNLYQWKSKNGVPCMALDLMDSIGDEIKAIVYMNHSSKECKQCGQMVEVGKVYCFQNGECKRDFIDKQALQLVFNLRTKSCWSRDVSCGGRNKIIIAPKIKIQPVFQNKVISISQLIEHLQSGKNTLSNIYGILESFKFNQFEKKGNNIQIHSNQADEDKSDPQIQLIQLQNPTKQKATAKKSHFKDSNKQGPTNIYLNGFLADPIERKKIAFACVVSKPLINGTQVLTAENFLTKNGIKKGALVILHNVRVQSTNNSTVHKLQKTKRTYMQIINDKNMKWQFNGSQFAPETVSINEIDQSTSLYSTLKQMLSFTQKEIDSIMQNPRVVNYSKQPFTQRSIYELNQLLQKSMMPQQNCFSEIKCVKIHYIQQKPSIDICFYCKKKAKSAQQKSNSNSHAIKHCQRCKMIVKTITMHIFNIVFADDTASFLVQVLKDQYLQTLLGIKIQDYLTMQQNQKKNHLDLIKYTEFSIKLRSEKKIGGIIHKINSIEKMPVKARIQEIKQQKKGQPKHYTRLDSSW